MYFFILLRSRAAQQLSSKADPSLDRNLNLSGRKAQGWAIQKLEGGTVRVTSVKPEAWLIYHPAGIFKRTPFLSFVLSQNKRGHGWWWNSQAEPHPTKSQSPHVIATEGWKFSLHRPMTPSLSNPPHSFLVLFKTSSLSLTKQKRLLS